jgi:hypothetical protein
VSIVSEITAIETYINNLFPDSSTGKQIIPKNPPVDSFYVRFLSDDRETETRYHFRITREYQIVYYAKWPEDVLPKMDALSATIYQTETIAPGIRVDSFGFSQPVKMDSGDIYASIGILSVSVREARVQPNSPLIENVSITQN